MRLTPQQPKQADSSALRTDAATSVAIGDPWLLDAHRRVAITESRHDSRYRSSIS